MTTLASSRGVAACASAGTATSAAAGSAPARAAFRRPLNAWVIDSRRRGAWPRIRTGTRCRVRLGMSMRVPWKDPSSGIARRPRRSEFPQGLHGFRCGRKQDLAIGPAAGPGSVPGPFDRVGDRSFTWEVGWRCRSAPCTVGPHSRDLGRCRHRYNFRGYAGHPGPTGKAPGFLQRFSGQSGEVVSASGAGVREKGKDASKPRNARDLADGLS